MKLRLFRFRDLSVCLLVVVTYAILFQIMLHTRLIEKVMTLTFSWWELLLIAGFLVSRLLTYLLVPSVLVAVGVHTLVQWAMRAKINRPRANAPENK